MNSPYNTMVPFKFSEEIVENFRKGSCFLLSFFLHEREGWDMKGVCENRFILHAISCPHNGGLVDVKGYYQNNNELLDDLPYSGRVEFRNIKKSDMKSYVEEYDDYQRRYAEIVSKRVISWYNKKVKV